MSEAGKAVFLSYASQDAEAAKRICEALQAAGVEVWFDQSELVGGDQWDQKIRRQIKECALLIPIISANTQSRTEGYFRLEWRLADQRTHLMAKGRPFLLPVVIDDTRDPEAHVPDSFTEVQWTKLPGGQTPEAFAERVRKLLGGGISEDRGQRTEVGTTNPMPARKSKFPLWLVAVIVALAVAAGIWQQRRNHEPAPVAAAPRLSGALQLVAKVWDQLNKPELARAELDTADGFGRQATELDPNDADAWAAWSQVDSWMVYHNFDASAVRREAARSKATRAMQLAPAAYEARLAQACYLVRGQAGGDATLSLYAGEAEKLLRGLLQEKPDEPRALLALGILLRNTGRFPECRDAFNRMAQHPAFAAQAWNELGWAEYFAGDYNAAGSAIDRSIAVQGYWGNLALKKIMAQWWLGDLDLAKAAQDQMPVAARQEDVGVQAAVELAYWRREPETMLQILGGMPRDWFQSNAFAGPTAYFSALAHQLAGREAAARLQWRTALAVVERRLAAQPDSGFLLHWKATLLAEAGDRVAAEPILKLAQEIGGTRSNSSDEARLLALLGHPDAALDLLEKQADVGARRTTAAAIRLNPALDPLRTNPRFQALLARMEADPRFSPTAKAVPAPSSLSLSPSTLSAADSKSVAVLAFANLSDDKGNEYFSDGISEELLNVLAKIPGLKVSARTSAFYFKGKEVPIPEIARQLGVAYVVEGSVRKQGNQVRITAQLIKAADGFHVWSDTFTRDLKDIFAVQDEIAGLVAKNLSLKLGISTGAVAAGVNPEAYRLYLEGREAWNRRDAEGFQRAELLFNRAIEIEPRFARAHAALADVWILLPSSTVGTFSQRHSPMIERTIAKAEQAVALDAYSAEAHAALGHVLGQAWRLPEAVRELRRAVALNPNYASAQQWLGRVLLMQGYLDEGVAALHRAAELDPLSHRILDNYSDALEHAGRVTESLAVLERARALHPAGVQIRCKQAMTLARLGRRTEALAAARALAADAQAEEPDYRYSSASATFAILGETAEAEAWLRRISPDSEDLPVARAYAGHIGEFVQGLDDLTINWLNYIWFDPRFSAIRAEPALREWAKRTGVDDGLRRAEAWLAAQPAGNQQ